MAVRCHLQRMSDLDCLSLTPIFAMQRAMASSTLCVDSQGGSQLHMVSCACPVLATPVVHTDNSLWNGCNPA